MLYIANINSAVYVLHAFQKKDGAYGHAGFGFGRKSLEADLIEHTEIARQWSNRSLRTFGMH